MTGPGCYVVSAPSLHASGGRYEWASERNPLTDSRDELRLVPPPGWLLEAATPRTAKSVSQVARPTAERASVERIMATALDKIRAGSGRNDAGLLFFTQLRDNGYDRDEAVLTVRDWVTKAHEAAPGQEKYTVKEAVSHIP